MFRLHCCITLAILFLNVSSSPHHHRSRHSHPRAKPSEILPDRYGKFVDEFDDRYGKSMEDKYDHSVEENGIEYADDLKEDAKEGPNEDPKEDPNEDPNEVPNEDPNEDAWEDPNESAILGPAFFPTKKTNKTKLNIPTLIPKKNHQDELQTPIEKQEQTIEDGENNAPPGFHGGDNTPAGENGGDNTPAGENGGNNAPAGENGENNAPAGVHGRDNAPAGKNGGNNAPAGENGGDNAPAGVHVGLLVGDNAPAGENGGNTAPDGGNGDGIVIDKRELERELVESGVVILGHSRGNSAPAGAHGEENAPAGALGGDTAPAGVHGEENELAAALGAGGGRKTKNNHKSRSPKDYQTNVQKETNEVKGKRQGIKAVMSNRLYKDHTKGRNMTQSLAEFGKVVSNLYNITKVIGKKHQ